MSGSANFAVRNSFPTAIQRNVSVAGIVRLWLREVVKVLENDRQKMELSLKAYQEITNRLLAEHLLLPHEGAAIKKRLARMRDKLIEPTSPNKLHERTTKAA